MSKLILVVDDEQDITESIAERLEANGYRVATASNGQLGLEHAKGGKAGSYPSGHYDAGYGWSEVFSGSQNEPGLEDIPVIFLTALVTKDEEEKLLGRIGDDPSIRMLAKPFEANKIIDTIEETFNA